MTGAYAAAGVDYEKIGPFKAEMKRVSRDTAHLPLQRWGVHVESRPHGVEYRFDRPVPHRFGQTLEGLGNKNWITEWMYAHDGTGRPRYRDAVIDTGCMAVNDLVAGGFMPFMWLDEVAAGDSDWFADPKRAQEFARGGVDFCDMHGMTVPAGESPALRYLVKPEYPVKSAPVLSGVATGILFEPHRGISGNIRPGQRIIGFASSGVHANGISLVVKEVLKLRDAFLTKLPNGKFFGDEILTPTRSYVRLVETLAQKGIYVDKFLPGTGSGIAKLATSKDEYTYRIHTWPEPPPVFDFLLSLGIPLSDCLTTFNWGIGYYAFVKKTTDVNRVLDVARQIGLPAWEVGVVKEGPRKVIFGPARDLELPPPAE